MMPKSTPCFLLALLVLPILSVSAQAPQQNLFPGISATPADAAFPGIVPTAGDAVLPGIVPSPMGTGPLSVRPSVLALPHLNAGPLSDALVEQAAESNFDISDPAWHYEQIACAALPDYVLLAFVHGPDREGSSRFVAIVPRDHGKVRIVATYAHGLLPFRASWSRPDSFEIFNSMLHHERGRVPLSRAPNWLLIGMCYAEVSGYPVQVLTALPNPEPTLDLLRLDANRPQMIVGSDGSANVTFSDVSRPGVTSNWNLHFDRQGALTSATQDVARQANSVALKATPGP